jgi:hypothetical protein
MAFFSLAAINALTAGRSPIGTPLAGPSKLDLAQSPGWGNELAGDMADLRPWHHVWDPPSLP